MDFDPRITSDGSGYGAKHGWHCNFHFGNGHDILDEDAQNEKSCVQALGFLIAKADAEIHDLEDELAILQCQLKWAESGKERKPYEVCCAAFKRKIDSLSSTIQSFKNGEVLSGHDRNGAVEVQRPAERIYDIIKAIISHNFSEHGEQVGDSPDGKNTTPPPTTSEIPKGKNQLVNSVSLNNDTDLRQEATSLKSSMGGEEQAAVLERQDKTMRTVSKESRPRAASATKESNEGREMHKSDVKVTGKAAPNAESHLEASISKGTTSKKPDASPHAETEKCTTGSKFGETGLSGFLPFSIKTELIVKSEKDPDTNIIYPKPIAADSPSETQGHEREYPAEDLSLNNINSDIIFTRKKSGLSSILKPQGQKVLKRKSPPSRSPSSNGGERKLGTEEHIVAVKLPRETGTRSPSKESLLSASKPRNGGDVLLPAPPQILQLNDDSKLTSESKSVSAKEEDQQSTENEDSLESLRLKFAEDPKFLTKLKVKELRQLMKQIKARNFHKLKKEVMIQELTKVLRPD